jgi:hypothetical protein
MLPAANSCSGNEPMRAKRTWRDVLILGAPKGDSAIRPFYEAWREERGKPLRCDKPVCPFHNGPLEWNGQALPLILDHLLGNRGDNTPGSLRSLCPNCDAQEEKTRGGANKGRIRDRIETGYTRLERDGTSSVIRAGVSVSGSTAAAVEIEEAFAD